jgi:PAS domain S-box-containing protein
MRDGLLLVRARDNVVVFVNPHLERMLGYPPGELLGMSSRGLYALEGSPAAEELRARARRAFEAGLELEYEATLRQRDGGALWCRGVSTAFEHPEHGRVQMSLFRERTEEMRALLADIVLSTTEAVVAVSPEGLVLTWNAGAQKLYGYGEAEAVGRPFAELTGAQAQTPEGAAPLVHDAAHRTRDGRVLDVVVTVSPIRTGAGALVALSKLIHDVTEARKAQRALAASLADKEVLLQEVHHRVKNNLQVVASLLRLQSEALLSDEAKEAFLETHERVRAIAMLHEVLYRSKSLGRIPLQEYALELVRSVARAHQLPGEPVELEVTAGPVLLSVETGVPLSLILNELLSNSFKHAFPQPRPSGVPARAVRVEVEQAQGSLEVLVADTGVGLPPGFSLEQGTGVGLQVVRSLVRQLKGTLVAEAGPGARWRLKFPNATGVSG